MTQPPFHPAFRCLARAKLSGAMIEGPWERTTIAAVASFVKAAADLGFTSRQLEPLPDEPPRPGDYGLETVTINRKPRWSRSCV